MPYLLFWVIDAPAAGTSGSGDDVVKDGNAGGGTVSEEEKINDVAVNV